MSDISALDSGSRNVAAWTVSIADAVAAAARWFAAARARRSRRISLDALLAYDAVRLNDLGLSRQDVLDAIRTARRRGA